MYADAFWRGISSSEAFSSPRSVNKSLLSNTGRECTADQASCWPKEHPFDLILRDRIMFWPTGFKKHASNSGNKAVLMSLVHVSYREYCLYIIPFIRSSTHIGLSVLLIYRNYTNADLRYYTNIATSNTVWVLFIHPIMAFVFNVTWSKACVNGAIYSTLFQTRHQV